jgi:hypothetical protein
MNGGTTGETREYALSEVIGFVLLLGVVVAVMAIWMLYVVPVNGREAEITHMNSVKDEFTNYKISLDSLWVNSPPGASYSQEGVTLSTSMNLGTGGGNSQVSGLFLPMMNPIPASAVLSIQPGAGDTQDTLNITTVGPSRPLTTFSYPMTTLKYQSQNNYWIQQVYYYQDGGVFLSQFDGTTCRVAPPMTFNTNIDMTSNVKITPISLLGSGSMGGNGPVRVDSQMNAINTSNVITKEPEYWVRTCVTVSNYTTARMWLDVFNNTRRIGTIYDSRNYTVSNSSPTDVPGWASITIKGPYDDSVNPDVYLSIMPVQYIVTINNIVSNLN